MRLVLQGFKYNMLYIGNFIDAKALKKNSCDDYRKMERSLFKI